MNSENLTEYLYDFLLQECREELQDLIGYQHHDEAAALVKDYCWKHFISGEYYNMQNSFIRYIFEDIDWHKLTFDLQDCLQ